MHAQLQAEYVSALSDAEQARLDELLKATRLAEREHVSAERARIHRDTDCNVVGVISILDREEGAEAAFAEAGLHFESLLTRSDIVNL